MKWIPNVGKQKHAKSENDYRSQEQSEVDSRSLKQNKNWNEFLLSAHSRIYSIPEKSKIVHSIFTIFPNCYAQNYSFYNGIYEEASLEKESKLLTQFLP